MEDHFTAFFSSMILAKLHAKKNTAYFNLDHPVYLDWGFKRLFGAVSTFLQTKKSFDQKTNLNK